MNIFTMTFLGIITLGISTIMSVISLFIASKMSMERNLITPFECGFDPLSMLHAPFSMRFFTITLVFLVFDVEIALLLPLMNAMIIPSKSALIILISFINLLLLGTLWEWNSGTLLWKQ